MYSTYVLNVFLACITILSRRDLTIKNCQKRLSKSISQVQFYSNDCFGPQFIDRKTRKIPFSVPITSFSGPKIGTFCEFELFTILNFLTLLIYPGLQTNDLLSKIKAVHSRWSKVFLWGSGVALMSLSVGESEL